MNARNNTWHFLQSRQYIHTYGRAFIADKQSTALKDIRCYRSMMQFLSRVFTRVAVINTSPAYLFLYAAAISATIIFPCVRRRALGLTRQQRGLSRATAHAVR